MAKQNHKADAQGLGCLTQPLWPLWDFTVLSVTAQRPDAKSPIAAPEVYKPRPGNQRGHMLLSGLLISQGTWLDFELLIILQIWVLARKTKQNNGSRQGCLHIQKG